MRSILIWLTTATLIACANGAAPGAVPRDAGRDAPVATVFAPPIDADAAPSAQVDAGHHKFGSSQPGHIHRETNFVDDDSGVTTIIADNATTGAADVTVHLVSPGGVSSVTGAGTVNCSPTTGAVTCTGTNAVASVTGAGSTSCSPTTGAVTCTTSNTVGNGLTGNTTLTAHSVLLGEGTSPISTVGPGGLFVPLIGQGAGNDPVFGTLSPTGGGTGVTSLTSGNLVVGNGGGAVTMLAPSTSGNVATSNGTTWTSAATVNSLTAGTDITLSGSTGAVTVSVTNPPALGFNATAGTLSGSNTGTFVAVTTASMTVPASANASVRASISCVDSVGGDTFEWGIGVDGSVVPYASQRGYCTNGAAASYCSGSVDMVVSGLSAASHSFALIQAIVGAVLPVSGAGCYGDILVTAN